MSMRIDRVHDAYIEAVVCGRSLQIGFADPFKAMVDLVSPAALDSDAENGRRPIGSPFAVVVKPRRTTTHHPENLRKQAMSIEQPVVWRFCSPLISHPDFSI
jgi:hypothetical protein